MRVLAICEHGINRSVAARWFLQHEGHEVIPIGLEHTDPDTLAMLEAWADKILVLDRGLLDEYYAPTDKLVVWHVGPDALYPHHLNRDLVARLRHWYGERPL